MKFESNWEESCFSFYIKGKVKKEGLDKCHLQGKKKYLVCKRQTQRWQGSRNQCGPGSISAVAVTCGSSLLVLYSAMGGFSPGTPVFPSHQKPTFDFI